MNAPIKIKAVLPANGWEPREDQMPAWSYLERGGDRLDICAHRRWGKDEIALHSSAVEAHKRIGTYWHMLPEANQARKAIWDAINPRTGRRRIDEAFPINLRKTTREQEMFIALKCGSTWQVVGSDNYNSLVGSPPIHVTLSEWALAKPEAWQYLRPILRENKGKAIFIWTPRGRNHATRAFDAREKDPMWFTQRIPAGSMLYKSALRPGVTATYKDIERITPLTGVFTSEDLLQELKELIEETGSEEEGMAIFNTEYLVDFDAPVPGAFYGQQMKDALTSGRIGIVPWTPGIKVDTSWDIGVDDYTAIWFWQRVKNTRLNAIGFFEFSGMGLDGCKEESIDLFPKYKWGMHYMPHDIKVREWGAGGRSRTQIAHGLGLRPIRVGVARPPAERIASMRKLFPYVHFDAEACETGIDHLKQYSRKWNKNMRIYVGVDKNGHDHAADAAGEFAVNAKLPDPPTVLKPKLASNDRYRRDRVREASNWKTA